VYIKLDALDAFTWLHLLGCIYLVAFTILHALGCIQGFAGAFTWLKKNNSNKSLFGDIHTYIRSFFDIYINISLIMNFSATHQSYKIRFHPDGHQIE
jgi:hypothetical protein